MRMLASMGPESLKLFDSITWSNQNCLMTGAYFATKESLFVPLQVIKPFLRRNQVKKLNDLLNFPVLLFNSQTNGLFSFF